MSEPEYVDPRTLRPGPIRHGSLPPDLLGQIRAVFDVIGPHIDMTLGGFEIGFMRDMHPEREVALWCGMAKAWLAYHEDFLGNETLPNEEERKLLGAASWASHTSRLGLGFLAATCRPRKSRMSRAIGSPSLSSAKWPASSRWNSSVLRSRL